MEQKVQKQKNARRVEQKVRRLSNLMPMFKYPLTRPEISFVLPGNLLNLSEFAFHGRVDLTSAITENNPRTGFWELVPRIGLERFLISRN